MKPLYPMLLAAWIVSGCPAPSQSDQGVDPASAVPGDKPATTVGDFDEDAVRKTLQGDWLVKRGARVLFEFLIEGDKARVIDRRFSEPRTIEGTLLIRSATGFGITDGDGVTSYYSVVSHGDEMYMGLGSAIATTGEEPFTAKLGAWESLVRLPGEEGCRYVKTWAGSTTEQTVPCSLKEKGGKTVFSYESEDPFRPGKMKTFELTRVGNTLLSRELAEARAVRRSEAGGDSGDATAAQPSATGPGDVGLSAKSTPPPAPKPAEPVPAPKPAEAVPAHEAAQPSEGSTK